jgi:macrolide-specific efflux system membrane fusion protein
MSSTLLLISSVLLSAQPASGPPSDRSNVARLPHCLVSLIDDVDLPAQETGILQSLDVKEGDRVTEGGVLAKIDDTDALVRKKAAEFRLAVAQERAVNDSDVKVKRKLIEYYKAEIDASRAINRRAPGTISEAELRVQTVRWESSVLEALKADMDFKIAGIEKKVAEAELEAVTNELGRRVVRAPFDGVVTKLYRKQSEWVQPGEPVLRIVRMDRLRVEGFVDADRYAPEQILGAEVDILVDLVGETVAKLTGTIDYVSPIVEANGDYRVRAEFQNVPGRGDYPWLVRPGDEAETIIKLKPLQLSSAR